ncbi:MAG TPA: carboxylating nicotinate-nucleotide diphosphorylase [Chloroflexota bacterium]|nr:carboxylating nicotinate-nucleotide diphosphorylase [Chloroflexota bacterium]
MSQFDLPMTAVADLVARALAEDIPWGDVTSENLIPVAQQGVGRIEARQNGILAGLPVARAVFAQVDPGLEFEPRLSDGMTLQPGQIVATLRGSLRTLLRGERVALNLLQRLSGIATVTDRYVKAVDGYPAHIIDTRKTTPGLRLLERYAVRVGGGHNHRFCLSDAVLIKDNHLAALRSRGVDLPTAISDLRQTIPHTVTIEVEAETLADVAEALAARVNAILLDNMPPELLADAVRLIDHRAISEASGGITLDTVRAVAATGVDLISVGALTHSVRSLDLSLEIEV